MPERTPASIAEYIASLTQYADSVNQPKEVKGREALETYMAKSYNGQTLLEATRLPGADDKAPTLMGFMDRSAGLPAAAANVPAVQQGINGVFTPSAAAFATTKAGISAVFTEIEKELKAKSMPVRSMIALPKTIDLLKTETLAEIDKVQKAEISALETYFNQPNTNADLQAVFPQATPDVIKKQLLEKLKEGHTKQRDEFTKTLDDSVKDLNKHFTQEIERINLLKYLTNTNEAMRKQIEEQNALFFKAKGTSMQTGISDQFAGVDLAKFDHPTTVTAQGLSVKDSSFSVTLRPKAWFFDRASYNPQNANFRLTDSEANLVDLMDLAARVMANGKDTITLTITSDYYADGDDQQQINAMVRQCIEACILKGFKPENITIKAMDKDGKHTVRCGEESKDKKIPLSQAIGGDSRFDKILEQGEIIRKKQERAYDPGLTQQEYKDELKRLRQAGQARVATADATPPPVTTTPGGSSP